MPPTAKLLVGLVAICLSASPAAATEPTLTSVIDQLIDERLSSESVQPAEQAADATFARRVTLDLAGRIPTAKELQPFLEDTAADKRQRLVDSLLASADFAFHQRNELDILLLARLQWNDAWRSYLLQAVREQRSWRTLFSELMLPEQLRPDDPGAAAFLKQRAGDLDALTNDTSQLLFGVNIGCAKCHDHPLVVDWLQDHYYGMASFFSRTYATRRGLIGEQFEGSLKFTTTDGEERDAQMMFLTGTTIRPPEPKHDEQDWKAIREQIKQAQRDDKAAAPPLPEFSPRQELVRLVLERDDEHFLARNIVNRLWARLLGRGLVHPLDQMHSENPPSHPELMRRLTEALIDHDYDLAYLTRAIVLSRTYQRDSRPADAGDRPPPPELFAVQTPRPLTPFQLSLSLWIASRHPQLLPGPVKPQEWPELRQQWEQQSEAFARRLEIPDEQFQVPVEEALLLANGEQAEREYLALGDGYLIGHLAGLVDDQQVIDEAFLSTLSRYPQPAERGAVAFYLTAREDRRSAALQQMVWALLASAEFRFNH